MKISILEKIDHVISQLPIIKGGGDVAEHALKSLIGDQKKEWHLPVAGLVGDEIKPSHDLRQRGSEEAGRFREAWQTIKELSASFRKVADDLKNLGNQMNSLVQENNLQESLSLE